MLSEAQLDAVFATKEQRKQRGKGKGSAFVRTPEGLVTETIKKMGDFDLGKHVGNVGTMKRSRKGRTYHAPNGRRSYQPHDYDTNRQEVVAYSLKK